MECVQYFRVSPETGDRNDISVNFHLKVAKREGRRNHIYSDHTYEDCSLEYFKNILFREENESICRGRHFI